MLKNYFKIAVRNLTKYKIYSAINIFGLAIGVACCILISLYVINEWSYDSFHAESDRIYRASVKEDYGEGDIYFNTTTPLVLKPTLEQHIPEIESATRRYLFNDLVKQDEYSESFSEPIQLVDPSFFSIFDFEFLKGDASSVFTSPNQVVLSEPAAKRYFDDEDPIQKSLLIKIGDKFQPFTVTGVIEEAPANSSIQYQILIPFEKGKDMFNPRAYQAWYNVAPETYVLLNKTADYKTVEAKFPAMMRQVLGDEEYENSNYTVALQPLTDIHLNVDMPMGIATVSNPVYSYVLAAIALLLLLIACINFMTISVSRSADRAKEVGIRKTIGALRRNLMYQFWGETLLMTVLALAVGIIFVELLLPLFNSLSGTHLSFTFNGDSMLLLIALTVSISLIAGVYPALILSGFEPIQILKGKLQIKGDKSLFHRSLVVFQFCLSIFLIASTLIIQKQLNYVRSVDLGYEKEQVLVIQTDATSAPGQGFSSLIDQATQKRDLLRSKIASLSSVKDISSSVYTPAQLGWISVDYRDPNDKKHEFNVNIVDEQYLKTMDISVTSGRHFSVDNTSDARRALIINEAMANEFNWENPVGKRLPGTFDDHEIIGVTENFNYESLHSEVKPLAITINPSIIFSGIDNLSFLNSPSPRITLKLASSDLPETINTIQTAWDEITGGQPFNYLFLDQAIDQQYRQEERLSKIVTAGSMLAIFIACLGLFGLASLSSSRRAKELGVRKVLGATSTSIVMLLNKEYTKLIVVAFFIAAPLSFYATHLWMQDFAYKTTVGITQFIIAGIVTTSIALLAVGYQSLKAALANPVDSLRSE
ncbi:MAG: FtsX-like permease family protein [Balneolaceae bacterium]|nr:FtsX-like permease family protein [Balneolaceae bacterium]